MHCIFSHFHICFETSNFDANTLKKKYSAKIWFVAMMQTPYRKKNTLQKFVLFYSPWSPLSLLLLLPCCCCFLIFSLHALSSFANTDSYLIDDSFPNFVYGLSWHNRFRHSTMMSSTTSDASLQPVKLNGRGRNEVEDSGDIEGKKRRKEGQHKCVHKCLESLQTAGAFWHSQMQRVKEFQLSLS